MDDATCTHASGSLTRRVESLWLSPSVARNGHNRKLFLSPRDRMSEGAESVIFTAHAEISSRRKLSYVRKQRRGQTVKLDKGWWRSHWGSMMIVPGGCTGRSLWLYIALVSIILCLAFLFYEAKTHPAQPTPPTSPGLHDSK